MQISVGEADRALSERLDEEIYAFNAQATGLYDGRLLTVRASYDGSLVGGLSGWTWGGCGYVDVLWVAADHRGRGLGTELLGAAEQEMTARGCIRVVLGSHSFQAPDFYRRRGYSQIAEIADYPVGHSEVFLSKNLPADDGR
jgi:ribosomal protein S18 acetylase RimI-like enzyme